MNCQTYLLVIGLVNIFESINSSDDVLTPITSNMVFHGDSSTEISKDYKNIGKNTEIFRNQYVLKSFLSNSSLVKLFAQVDPKALQEIIGLLEDLKQQTQKDRNILDTNAGNADIALTNAIAVHEAAVSEHEVLGHDLDRQITVIQRVIDDLHGINKDGEADGEADEEADGERNVWELIATVGENDSPNTAFWDNICVNVRDLTRSDIVLVEMGEIKDYFKPLNVMNFCHFIKSGTAHSWSPTVDGAYNFLVPDPYVINDPYATAFDYHYMVPDPDADDYYYGGSRYDWPKSIDGRDFLSFWGYGTPDDEYSYRGGCCHSTSNLYGGEPDASGWGKAFKMYLRNAH